MGAAIGIAAFSFFSDKLGEIQNPLPKQNIISVPSPGKSKATSSRLNIPTVVPSPPGFRGPAAGDIPHVRGPSGPPPNY